MYIYIYIPIFIYNSTHIFISICTRIFSRGYSCVMHSILVHAHTFRLIQGVFESSQLCVPWVVACVTWLTYVCTAFYFRTRTHTHTRTVCVCVMVHGPWAMSRVTWLTCTHVCTEFNIVHTHYRLILDSWSVGLELHLFHERHRAFVTRSRSWVLLSRRAAAYHVRGRCIACFESCHVCFRRVMSHVSHVPCMCLLHSTWELHSTCHWLSTWELHSSCRDLRTAFDLPLPTAFDLRTAFDLPLLHSTCHWLCATRRIQCVFGVYSVCFFSH